MGISDPTSFPEGGYLWYQVPWGHVQGGGCVQEGGYSPPDMGPEGRWVPTPRHGTWDTKGYGWQAGGMYPTQMFSLISSFKGQISKSEIII